MLITGSPRHRQKPRLGARVNGNHRLAHGHIATLLLNEFGGRTLASQHPRIQGTITGTASWEAGQTGPALSFVGGGTEVNYIDVGTDDVFSLSEFTLFAKFRASSSQAAFQVLMNRQDGSSDRNWWLATWSDGRLIGRVTVAGASKSSINTVSVRDDTWHTAMFSAKSGGNLTLYIDGLQVDQDAVGTIDTQSGRRNTVFSEQGGAGRDWDGDLETCSWWNRELGASDAALLHRDPYAFFQPMTIRIPLVVAAAAVGNPWNYYAQQ